MLELKPNRGRPWQEVETRLGQAHPQFVLCDGTTVFEIWSDECIPYLNVRHSKRFDAPNTATSQQLDLSRCTHEMEMGLISCKDIWQRQDIEVHDLFISTTSGRELQKHY